MIKGILKTATKAAINWVGGKLGVPSDITEKVTDVTDSLFTKSDAGGGARLRPAPASRQMPRFAGRLPFQASRMAGGAKGYAETVNPETLYAAWDRRLGKYYSDKYKVARTVKGKVV